MNKLVKLPIFLGICGGACAGILAGVNAFTAPIIEKNAEEVANAAIYEYFDNDKSIVIEKDQEISSTLTAVGVVSKIKVTKQGVNGMVYECHTSSSFGAINFQVAISNGNFIGYTDLGNEQTASIGGKAINNMNATINGKVASNNNSFVLTTGATVTTTAIKEALDAIAADYLGGN